MYDPEKAKQYYEANKSRILQRQREQKKKDRDKINDWRRKYDKRPEVRDKFNARRRGKSSNLNKQRRAKAKQHIQTLKAGGQCPCGVDSPECLQYHHRDPSTKLFDISAGVRRGFSISKLNREVAKCDLICANCHFKLHAKKKAG